MSNEIKFTAKIYNSDCSSVKNERNTAAVSYSLCMREGTFSALLPGHPVSGLLVARAGGWHPVPILEGQSGTGP